LVDALNAVPFGVTNRKGKRIRAGRELVGYSFVTACHVAVLSDEKPDGFLGWHRWLVGTASEPLLPRRAVERRSLSL
jgi:hypothetical protein